MRGVFQKSILKVGRYHSPDGEIEVTPQRLRHWANQFKRLHNARQVVPMHWDHGSDLENLQPVAMDAFQRRERSARNSVGRMRDFRVSPSGDSAEVIFETRDAQATKAVGQNNVYVSPVIFPKWRDGAGNQYRDLITHLDLVNHPVDHSQSDARPVKTSNRMPVVACALRMGLDVKPYRMGALAVDDERDDMELENDGTDDLMGDGDQMADDGGEMADQGDFDMGSDDDYDFLDDGIDEPEGPGVGDLMMALADHGVVLPDDTNDSNFMDRLRTALIAKKGGEPDVGGLEDQDTFDQPGDTIVADPQMATMSLERQYANREYQARLKRQLDSLLKTGRCTPAEFEQRKHEAAAVRLSLNSQGEPKPTKLAEWIKDRRSLPQGAVWSNKEKLRRMSAAPSKHPDALDTAGRSDEALDEQVKKFLKR